MCLTSYIRVRSIRHARKNTKNTREGGGESWVLTGPFFCSFSFSLNPQRWSSTSIFTMQVRLTLSASSSSSFSSSSSSRKQSIARCVCPSIRKKDSVRGSSIFLFLETHPIVPLPHFCKRLLHDKRVTEKEEATVFDSSLTSLSSFSSHRAVLNKSIIQLVGQHRSLWPACLHLQSKKKDGFDVELNFSVHRPSSFLLSCFLLSACLPVCLCLSVCLFFLRMSVRALFLFFCQLASAFFFSFFRP
mmetsp:Transcript_37095/g.72978  ORF Transcript_37095/g.72978 Transcript_37095/m.72978 type:complete len:245 (+) Transcript_37095:1199-1933(+)